jgi:osmotically-inducible protein OsmY
MLDTEIARNVLDELLWDDRIGANKINVNVANGNVKLTGAVETYHEKWDAGEDAWRMLGVRSVDNEILVDLTAEKKLDSDLMSAAEQGLAANSLVPPGAIQLSVSDGWVTMAGNVHHYYERDAAEFVIRHLNGLRGYTENVMVSRAPAEDVSRNITESLTRNAAVDSNKIQVTDDGGVVTLKGTVRNYAERQEAERAASSSPGVIRVQDELTIAAG